MADAELTDERCCATCRGRIEAGEPGPTCYGCRLDALLPADYLQREAEHIGDGRPPTGIAFLDHDRVHVRDTAVIVIGRETRSKHPPDSLGEYIRWGLTTHQHRQARALGISSIYIESEDMSQWERLIYAGMVRALADRGQGHSRPDRQSVRSSA